MTKFQQMENDGEQIKRFVFGSKSRHGASYVGEKLEILIPEVSCALMALGKVFVYGICLILFAVGLTLAFWPSVKARSCEPRTTRGE